jgi:hypothetical protein
MCRAQLYAVESHKFFGIFLSKLCIKNRVSISQYDILYTRSEFFEKKMSLDETYDEREIKLNFNLSKNSFYGISKSSKFLL